MDNGTLNALADGCMMFSEYCTDRSLIPNGNIRRKLKQLAPEYRRNLTPSAARPTWAVQTDEADKLFIKKRSESK